jgi:hypothetical protein
MSTLVKVARYHLQVERVGIFYITWGVLAFDFLVNLAIAAQITPGSGKPMYTGALASIYIIMTTIGTMTIIRTLPLGLVLGMSRRSYYAGTALLAVVIAVVYGLGLTLLQLLERATDGWGLRLYFFRVTYILSGPWYLTWLTSLVGLALLFVYGMWYGIVARRWNVIGVLAFIAIQVLVLAAAAIAVSRAGAWRSVGHFFTTLSAAGLTGLLAGLTLVMLAGGYTTIRRITV